MLCEVTIESSVLRFPSKMMDFPKLFIILYQCHKTIHRKHIMDIKQYLLIYFRVLVLQFCFRKDSYTLANICPVSDNGHNIWLIQYDENYNHFITLLQLPIDSATNVWWSMTSSTTLVNLKPLVVATTGWCLLVSAPKLKKMLYQQSLYFFIWAQFSFAHDVTRHTGHR